MNILGIMCGSSMDGADLALCEFENGVEHFRIVKSDSFNYTKEIHDILSNASKVESQQLLENHIVFGKFLSGLINDFLITEKCDLIALHGHTVFHEPKKGFSFQLGDPNVICSRTNTPVVSDFRNLDISNGGEGAPLVPNAEKELFPDFSVFLNLGGIANISIHDSNGIIARDLCIFNQALNHICSKFLNVPFDNEGNISRKGNRIDGLYNSLNELTYYQTKGPASLDRIWFEKHMIEILNQFETESADNILRTLIDHFSKIISDYINELNEENKTVFISGGGAFNSFFIEKLSDQLNSQVYIPQKELIEFKEAIIFALLGLKRLKNEVNCKAEVSGADKDSIGGALYGNFKSLI